MLLEFVGTLDPKLAVPVEITESTRIERTSDGRLQNQSHVLIGRQNTHRTVNLVISEGISRVSLGCEGSNVIE